ncbi:MAG: DUF1659 domain-containing protein [Bacillota bacterium]|nr:DUF1659 domain-containing protein [Bacillota bacterium]MDW7678878.1 DUF1659 domain-containing protein [Bacillota bacterium]
MSERMNETCSMQLRFINAIVEGREQLVSRTFSGVKLTATDDNLLLAAYQLAMLQVKTLKHVNRIDRAELIEA